ncbi:hypothetical protein SAMN04487926_15515 [Paraburkholderia steynii]|uniref:Uncharacterized protein n=1 Tax=Paraburkholderia steynii TaxID=1245441 RepID=A0A7Z7FR37_9BURK|nr:hypothetical protein [Paraburkholderia steynii]SDJ49145.1 hypothetical protein SAMN04487926_15515 [Paraburkholderia steynii]
MFVLLANGVRQRIPLLRLQLVFSNGVRLYASNDSLFGTLSRLLGLMFVGVVAVPGAVSYISFSKTSGTSSFRTIGRQQRDGQRRACGVCLLYRINLPRTPDGSFRLHT